MTETNEADVRDNTDPKKSNVAVVTGSSKGMGRAIVLAFAMSNTYTVIVVNARKRGEAERVAKEVPSQIGSKDLSQPMDKCCFDIMTQMEKKAGFLYYAAVTCIQHAQLQTGQSLHIFGVL